MTTTTAQAPDLEPGRFYLFRMQPVPGLCRVHTERTGAPRAFDSQAEADTAALALQHATGAQWLAAQITSQTVN